MRLQSFFVNIHRRVLFFGFSLFSLTICERNCVELFLVSALTNSAVVTVERKNDEGWVRSRDQLDSNLSYFPLCCFWTPSLVLFDLLTERLE